MKRRSLWDLVDDEATGRLQTSKIWVHVGNLTATIVIFWKLVVEPAQVDEALLFTYMGWLIGGYGFMYKAAGRRQGNAGNTEALVEGQDDVVGGSGGGDLVFPDRGGGTPYRQPDCDGEADGRAKGGGSRARSKSSKGKPDRKRN